MDILGNPPYLQIALDIVDIDILEHVLEQINFNEKIIFEAGTPLIKKYGVGAIRTIRNYHPNAIVVADMKTLDVGALEVHIAAEADAQLVSISALSSEETIELAIKQAKEENVGIILDMMNVGDPPEVIESLSSFPDVILFHRGIDQEGRREHPWKLIKKIKHDYPSILIAVAGGLNLKSSKKALENGADIIVIGRAITQADNITATVKSFLSLLTQ